ncbi:MAG: NgoBV family restriction endonuclease [Muribaculaceae bacterium]|nr:NgoBV family restriction endonuclease [Muribaculaceae bacterium]
MKSITADLLYDKLINEDNILTVKGQIRFYLGDVDIVVKQRDVVGNIMQEWLEGWLKKNDIEYSANENTQMPPDIYLNPRNKQEDMLEVKAFNYQATPGFDIADFRAFHNEIVAKPYMLHVKYLIFGYVMSDDGYVSIKNVWLKSVWEITRPMAKWALNLQIKEGVVHKIRPAKFYAKPNKFDTFKTLEDFLSAMEECVYQNPETHKNASMWKHNIVDAYKKHYGITLKIPRWHDICSRYVLK